MNRDFKGIWIPREIWLNPSISIQAKALWAEIYSLHNREKGGCFASDEYLMNFLSVKISRLHEVMKELKDHGLLEKVSFDGRNRIIKAVVTTKDYRDPANDLKDPESNKDLPEMTGSQGSGKPEGCIPENRNIDNSIEEEKKKKKKRAPQVSIEFDYSINQFANISESDLADWKALYPQVDISHELLKMRQWLMDPANPDRDGNRTFITNWLSRAAKEKAKTPKKTIPEPKEVPEGHPYNGSLAYGFLNEDGVEKYKNYLKTCADKTYYNNFLNGIYEEEYINFLNKEKE